MEIMIPSKENIQQARYVTTELERPILHISDHTSSFSFSLRRRICSAWRNTLDAASIWRFQWVGKFGWWLDLLLVMFFNSHVGFFCGTPLYGVSKVWFSFWIILFRKATHTSRVKWFVFVFWWANQHNQHIFYTRSMLYQRIYLLAYSCRILSICLYVFVGRLYVSDESCADIPSHAPPRIPFFKNYVFDRLLIIRCDWWPRC